MKTNQIYQYITYKQLIISNITTFIVSIISSSSVAYMFMQMYIRENASLILRIQTLNAEVSSLVERVNALSKQTLLAAEQSKATTIINSGAGEKFIYYAGAACITIGVIILVCGIGYLFFCQGGSPDTVVNIASNSDFIAQTIPPI